mgnify:CR=1 FL=1
MLRIAHRGASAEAPENTLAAIRRAIELGAPWVEVDVQACADGLVVIHDDGGRAVGGDAQEGRRRKTREVVRFAGFGMRWLTQRREGAKKEKEKRNADLH